MALGAIVASVNEGYLQVVDVDLKSYFDTIDHELLMRLVERRVGDIQILRLIRAWLKAGVMEEGKVTHPDRGSPQGGVISPLLSNIFLHESGRQQQPDVSQGGLGGAERDAVMAPAQASVCLGNGSGKVELPRPS